VSGSGKALKKTSARSGYEEGKEKNVSWNVTLTESKEEVNELTLKIHERHLLSIRLIGHAHEPYTVDMLEVERMTLHRV
jgi:hypothetical protein